MKKEIKKEELDQLTKEVVFEKLRTRAARTLESLQKA